MSKSNASSSFTKKVMILNDILSEIRCYKDSSRGQLLEVRL